MTWPQPLSVAMNSTYITLPPPDQENSWISRHQRHALQLYPTPSHQQNHPLHPFTPAVGQWVIMGTMIGRPHDPWLSGHGLEIPAVWNLLLARRSGAPAFLLFLEWQGDIIIPDMSGSGELETLGTADAGMWCRVSSALCVQAQINYFIDLQIRVASFTSWD